MPEPRPAETMLLVTEVAKILRLSRMTVYRLCKSGDLEAYRMRHSIRIPERAVRDYLAAARADVVS